MKYKMVVITVLSAIMIILGVYQTYAYSPDCLPGGINYLSSENFFFDGDKYGSIDPFLVKPYTEYTLTIPKLYYDEQWGQLDINLYEDGSIVDVISFTHQSFTHYDDGVDEWFYATFSTYYEVNYISIEFDNIGDYFSSYFLNNFQLEEGDHFSGYEAYIPGTIIDTSAPYFQNSGTIISYVDSPITISEIGNALSAYDEVDGDVSNNIVLVNDQYIWIN